MERVSGNVRQKYSILQSTLPIDFINKRKDEDSPMIDGIIRVCCALCNILSLLNNFLLCYTHHSIDFGPFKLF